MLQRLKVVSLALGIVVQGVVQVAQVVLRSGEVGTVGIWVGGIELLLMLQRLKVVLLAFGIVMQGVVQVAQIVLCRSEVGLVGIWVGGI